MSIKDLTIHRLLDCTIEEIIEQQTDLKTGKTTTDIIITRHIFHTTPNDIEDPNADPVLFHLDRKPQPGTFTGLNGYLYWNDNTYYIISQTGKIVTPTQTGHSQPEYWTTCTKTSNCSNY